MAETNGTSGVGGLNHYTRYDVQPNNSDMSMDDFWKLLAAQLRYQDMSNPMSNSEMMNQMTQMASMNAMNLMSKTISSAMNSMSQISLSTYATDMLGKEVTVADLDEKTGELIGKTVGIVEGVDLSGMNPVIYVNGKKYSLSQIMNVGKVPGKEDGDTEVDAPEEEEGSQEVPEEAGEAE